MVGYGEVLVVVYSKELHVSSSVRENGLVLSKLLPIPMPSIDRRIRTSRRIHTVVCDSKIKLNFKHGRKHMLQVVRVCSNINKSDIQNQSNTYVLLYSFCNVDFDWTSPHNL